ncbi:hypothetical protein CDD82_4012 [Ophiocordyceps australis]|uniref:Epoxide hydrolase N-terminal domain-containing protein n=1 Tax=Ophiocordyceps australis TaxID=1399860 RepID=A0A2C5ZPJ0_9HYPO|nr:hypothetical protein CDD82_4012 [Ophiocordyceps australis]
MARHEALTANIVVDEDIKSYRVHVSSKYLDLTRRKLELTRLPHRAPEPRTDQWWEPRATVEPLLDFWLERFSWRNEEKELNSKVPQFRTAIKTAASEVPIRLHFIHAQSPHARALPLLLIPPFPFSNLALAHLVMLFTHPIEMNSQSFHMVMPSLPGLGFSDALPDRQDAIETIADMFDTLMRRLGYAKFLVTTAGASAYAPARVDWRIAHYLACYYSTSCMGAHLVSPPLKAPSWTSPLEWVKWKAASLLRRPIFGYCRQDVDDWRKCRSRLSDKTRFPAQLSFGGQGAYEPNALAYALCDSPLGLLLFFLMVIRGARPARDLPSNELIKITELAWIPGPEGMMRLWANCQSCTETGDRRRGKKPKVAITVFQGAQGSSETQHMASHGQPWPLNDEFACPGWARGHYDVVSSSRISGRPGLLAWERPQVIVAGTRGLAKAILTSFEHTAAAALEQVVVGRQVHHQEATRASETTLLTTEADEAASTSQAGAGLTAQGISAQDDEELSEGSPDTVIAVQLG